MGEVGTNIPMSASARISQESPKLLLYEYLHFSLSTPVTPPYKTFHNLLQYLHQSVSFPLLQQRNGRPIESNSKLWVFFKVDGLYCACNAGSCLKLHRGLFNAQLQPHTSPQHRLAIGSPLVSLNFLIRATPSPVSRTKTKDLGEVAFSMSHKPRNNDRF